MIIAQNICVAEEYKAEWRQLSFFLCCHIGSYGEWLIFLFYFFIDERCILMLTLNKSTKYKIQNKTTTAKILKNTGGNICFPHFVLFLGQLKWSARHSFHFLEQKQWTKIKLTKPNEQTFCVEVLLALDKVATLSYLWVRVWMVVCPSVALWWNSDWPKL